METSFETMGVLVAQNVAVTQTRPCVIVVESRRTVILAQRRQSSALLTWCECLGKAENEVGEWKVPRLSVHISTKYRITDGTGKIGDYNISVLDTRY